MDQSEKFNEVSITYNNCVANLDSARQIFQDDLKKLNCFVAEHLEEVCSDQEKPSFRHRWGGPEDWSTSKAGTWRNFISSQRIWLDIRQTDYTNFAWKAAYLYFESRFDKELCRFMFQCRLENQNVVNEFIDEELIKIIGLENKEKFPYSVHVKSNRAILFKKELDDQIFSYLNQDIDNAIATCNETVASLYPSNLYEEDNAQEEDRDQ